MAALPVTCRCGAALPDGRNYCKQECRRDARNERRRQRYKPGRHNWAPDYKARWRRGEVGGYSDMEATSVEA